MILCMYVLGDDTIKLWDIRAIKKPLNAVGNLDNVFPMTSCAFSPDDQIITTGTSVKPGEVSTYIHSLFYSYILRFVAKN